MSSSNCAAEGSKGDGSPCSIRMLIDTTPVPFIPIELVEHDLSESKRVVNDVESDSEYHSKLETGSLFDKHLVESQTVTLTGDQASAKIDSNSRSVHDAFDNFYEHFQTDRQDTVQSTRNISRSVDDAASKYSSSHALDAQGLAHGGRFSASSEEQTKNAIIYDLYRSNLLSGTGSAATSSIEVIYSENDFPHPTSEATSIERTATESGSYDDLDLGDGASVRLQWGTYHTEEAIVAESFFHSTEKDWWDTANGEATTGSRTDSRTEDSRVTNTDGSYSPYPDKDPRPTTSIIRDYSYRASSEGHADDGDGILDAVGDSQTHSTEDVATHSENGITTGHAHTADWGWKGWQSPHEYSESADPDLFSEENPAPATPVDPNPTMGSQDAGGSQPPGGSGGDSTSQQHNWRPAGKLLFEIDESGQPPLKPPDLHELLIEANLNHELAVLQAQAEARKQAADAAARPEPYQGYWHGVGQTAKGYFWNGPKSAIEGVVNAAIHPLQTLQGIGTAIRHPIDTGKAIANDIADKWNHGSAGQGQVAFDIATTILGGAKTAEEAAAQARKLVDIVKRLKTVGKEAATVVEAAEPEAVAVSRTTFGPEHGRGNIKHNNAIEDLLDAAKERGATDLRKNRVQRNALGERVRTPEGKFTRPDAAYIENGVRTNYNRVSNLDDIERELEAFNRMIEADPDAINILEF